MNEILIWLEEQELDKNFVSYKFYTKASIRNCTPYALKTSKANIYYKYVKIVIIKLFC